MKPFVRTAAVWILAAASLSVQAKELTVSAAASLKDAFQEIGTLYKQQYGTEIRLNTAASGQLVQQLAQGAPADVLATADEASMDTAVQKNTILPQTRKTFVRNDLVLAVPAGSPLNIKSAGDLQQAGVQRIAIGNPDSVPAGRYAKESLEASGLYGRLKDKFITTQNVRQALDYIARGEVEAGFVYRTDAALAAKKVTVKAVMPLKTPVRYPIAVTRAAADAAEAQRFVSFVLSPAGRNILNRYGFSKP